MKINKILITLIFVLLLVNIFSFNAVSSGEQDDWIEDYYDDNIASTDATDSYYGDEWVTTWDTDLAFNGYVDTAQKHSDTKSFKTGRSGYSDGGSCTDTYINFSIGGNIIGNLSWWAKWNFDSGASTNMGGEIYHFLNGNGTELFAIHHKRIGVSDPQRRFYYEDLSGFTTMYNCYGNEWNHFWITRNNSEAFTVHRYSVTGGTAQYTGGVFESTQYGNITQIWIEHWGGNGVAYLWYLWIDDVEIGSFDQADSDEENPTIPPCSPYDTIGKLNIGGTNRHSLFRYLWSVYGVSTKMYINRLDLEISDILGDEITNSNVECKINEANLGIASSLVQISDNTYRLSWSGISVFVNNTPTAISFKFKNPIISPSLGRIILPCPSSDPNLDGYHFMYFYGDDGYYDNHGTHIYDTPGSTLHVEHYPSNEPLIRLCVDKLANAELNPDLVNSIACVPNNISVGEYTKITYSVNQNNYSSNMFINVQKEGSANISYAKINTQSSYVQYTALSESDYYANLSIDGETVASDTFSVVGSIDDYVYTYPNPSLPNSWFTLYYNYSKADYGSIRIFDTNNDLVNTFPIDPTSSGTIQVQLSSGSYLIKLCKIVNSGTGTVYVSVFDYPHSVFSNQIAFIDVVPRVSPTAYPVSIWGQHSHTGQNVIVRWGDTEIQNVGNKQQFAFSYSSEKQGSYPLELVIINENESRTVLSSVDLTFNDGYYTEYEKDWFRQQLDNIPVFYKVLIGIILTIIGFLLPYILLIKLNANRKIPVQFNISATLSLCTGLFTSCASAYIGFYGWEFPAIGIMLVLLSVFIMYLMGNKPSGG